MSFSVNFIHTACDYRGKLNQTSDGKCLCKDLVVSETCSKCSEGYWNLTQANPQGCQRKLWYFPKHNTKATLKILINRFSYSIQFLPSLLIGIEILKVPLNPSCFRICKKCWYLFKENFKGRIQLKIIHSIIDFIQNVLVTRMVQRMATYVPIIQQGNADASLALMALTVTSVETIIMDLEPTLTVDAKVRPDLLL